MFQKPISNSGFEDNIPLNQVTSAFLDARRASGYDSEQKTTLI
jgi:hypothetical protein